MTEDVKKKLQTTQRRMLRMIVQTERKAQKGTAAAHAANLDDVESHLPVSEPDEDTTEGNVQDSNEQEESSHDADSNPSFNSLPQDDETTEDELEPWVDKWCAQATRQTALPQPRSRRGSSDRAERSGSKPEGLPNISATDGQGLISKWSPATSTKQEGCRKRGRPAKNMGRRLQLPSTTK